RAARAPKSRASMLDPRSRDLALSFAPESSPDIGFLLTELEAGAAAKRFVIPNPTHLRSAPYPHMISAWLADSTGQRNRSDREHPPWTKYLKTSEMLEALFGAGTSCRTQAIPLLASGCFGEELLAARQLAVEARSCCCRSYSSIFSPGRFCG